MRYILTAILFYILNYSSAQQNFPYFLQGAWKMEGQEIYEQWDKLNEDLLKGFGYKTNQGNRKITEYFEIARKKKKITYTASVIGQNNGKGIDFKMTKSDGIYVFENPNHDFPKKIVYQKLSETEILVQISDGKEKSFEYKMHKLGNEIHKDNTSSNPNYDEDLAQKLGADDYGMKAYILVMLKTGSNKSTDKDFINNCFRGHMDNINRLVEEGKMIVAGPLGKNDQTYRGIFILNTTNFEEAKALLENDAAIKEGILAYDLYNWYGSAALAEYLVFSDRVWKVKP